MLLPRLAVSVVVHDLYLHESHAIARGGSQVEVLHQVEHRLDHPRRREDLPMVGDALFGLDVVHGAIHCGRWFFVVIAA